jgi:hypothetical protein
MRHWQVPDGWRSPSDEDVPRRLSRAQALRGATAAAVVVGGVSAVDVAPAVASWRAQPRPIPGGLSASFKPVPHHPFIHVLPPAVGFEMSTITDFRGVIAAGEIQGEARGSDGSAYSFDADMRFMRGQYVGRDGRRRVGSFGFV